MIAERYCKIFSLAESRSPRIPGPSGGLMDARCPLGRIEVTLLSFPRSDGSDRPPHPARNKLEPSRCPQGHEKMQSVGDGTSQSAFCLGSFQSPVDKRVL